MLEVRRTRSGNYAQLWPAYNSAQTNEKLLFTKLLFEICRSIEGIEEPAEHPRLPLCDIIFCMVFKVYLQLEELIDQRGLRCRDRSVFRHY